MIFFFQLSLLFFIIFLFKDIVLSGLYEKRLLKYLFDSSRPDAHNPIERPSANDTETLNDEKNQVLTTIIWMDLVSSILHLINMNIFIETYSIILIQ
ncbi:uncharacterized protein DC041_0007295 [Schistosoma bovis]|uniref:Uncharacterized protein n=1 Tax=Schistosoma bovis TaxID=6184 RepID=A0A430QEV1_SCHBO|nr:uncharacterized protein DC041_0007295 [Schistosoma bovis]